MVEVLDVIAVFLGNESVSTISLDCEFICYNSVLYAYISQMKAIVKSTKILKEYLITLNTWILKKVQDYSQSTKQQVTIGLLPILIYYIPIVYSIILFLKLRQDVLLLFPRYS